MFLSFVLMPAIGEEGSIGGKEFQSLGSLLK